MIPVLNVKQPPVIRPYFVVKVVGDGAFDFTKAVASDTDEEIEVSNIFFKVEEGQTKPKLILTLKNPACNFSSSALTSVTASPPATLGPPAGFIPKGFVNVPWPPPAPFVPSLPPGPFGPGHTMVPGSFPSGSPSNQGPQDDPADSFGCKHEYVKVHLFTSTIDVCKLCKKEKP